MFDSKNKVIYIIDDAKKNFKNQLYFLFNLSLIFSLSIILLLSLSFFNNELKIITFLILFSVIVFIINYNSENISFSFWVFIFILFSVIFLILSFISFNIKLIISIILVIIFWFIFVKKINDAIANFFKNIFNLAHQKDLKINLNYIYDFYLDSNMPEFNFITKNNFIFKFVNDFIFYNFKNYINQDSFRYIMKKAITLDFNPLSLKKHSFISILDIIFTNDKRSEIFFNGIAILFDSFKYLNYKPIIIFKYPNINSNLNYKLDLNNLKLSKKSLEIMEIPIEKNNSYIIDKSEIVFSDNDFSLNKDLYNKNEIEHKISLISSYFYDIDFDVILFKDAGFTLNQENDINFIYYKNDLDNFYFIKDKIIETIDLLNKFQNFIIIIFRSSIYIFIDNVSINDLIVKDLNLNILPSNNLEKYIWAIDIAFSSSQKIYQKLEPNLKSLYEKINSQKVNEDFLVILSNSLKKI
ncbi:MAG: hypothetical protein ACP5RD_00730 [bacterium]